MRWSRNPWGFFNYCLFSVLLQWQHEWDTNQKKKKKKKWSPVILPPNESKHLPLPGRVCHFSKRPIGEEQSCPITRFFHLTKACSLLRRVSLLAQGWNHIKWLYLYSFHMHPIGSWDFKRQRQEEVPSPGSVNKLSLNPSSAITGPATHWLLSISRTPILSIYKCE